MNNLNSILNIDLRKTSISEIDEEKLLLFKSEDYYSQTNLYFYLQNQLFNHENNPEASAYIHYLISYYLMVILTPLCYEELAFNHINQSLKLSRKIKYKEWALIFATLEHPYLNSSEALTLAQDVIKENPNSNIANTILALFY